MDQPSADQLAQYIRVLIEDSALHRLMSENCLDQWKEKFSEGVMGANYVKLYHKVLAKYKHRHLGPQNTH
jgi:glycosyltransferase involved in cell wall biosynthesis